MLRFLIAVVGLVQLYRARKSRHDVRGWPSRGPEAFTVRQWVVPAMRLEGLLLLWLAVNGLEAGESDEAALSDQASFAKASVPEMFSM